MGSAQCLDEGAESRRRPRRPDFKQMRLISECNNSTKKKSLIVVEMHAGTDEISICAEHLISKLLKPLLWGEKPYPEQKAA